MNELSVAFLELFLADWTPEEDGHIYYSEEDLLPEDYSSENEKYSNPVEVFISISLVKFRNVDDILSMFAFH